MIILTVPSSKVSLSVCRNSFVILRDSHVFICRSSICMVKEHSCLKITTPWFCLKYKTSVRKLQDAFPAFLAAIGRRLSNEEIVASLGWRENCSEGCVRRTQKETAYLSGFFLGIVLPTLTVFLYLYLHGNKLRFTQ